MVAPCVPVLHYFGSKFPLASSLGRCPFFYAQAVDELLSLTRAPFNPINPRLEHIVLIVIWWFVLVSLVGAVDVGVVVGIAGGVVWLLWLHVLRL